MLQLGLFLLGVVAGSWGSLWLARYKKKVWFVPRQNMTECRQTEQILRESEERFRWLIQNVDVGIILAGANAETLTCNQMALELLGLSESERVSQTALDRVSNAIHEDGSAFDPECFPIPQAIATRQAIRNVVMGIPRPNFHDLVWLLVSAVPQFDADQNVHCVICSFNDITARKQAEVEAQQQARQEQAFSRIIQTIRNSLDRDTIFATATCEFAELLQFDSVRVSQYFPERRCWIPVVEHIRKPGALSLLGLEIPDENNPIKQRLKQRQVVMVENSHTLTDPVNRAIAQRYEPLSYFMVPLEVNGSVWGCLVGVSPLLPNCFTEQQVHLAQRFADQLAIAIQQAELYQQVQQLNQELEQRVQERTTELAKSRDLFEAVFQESADAIFLVEADTLLILDCNQRAVELFEAADKTQLIGLQGHTFHAAPFSDAELAKMRHTFGLQGVWSQEIEYRTFQGHNFWGNLASKRIQVAGHRMNLVRITDISQRRAAEAALQISEQNLRTIFDNVSGQILIHDVDGTLLEVNERVLEFQGLDRAQVLKLSLLEDCSAPDAPLHLAQTYWDRALAGESVTFEWKGRKPIDGSLFDSETTLTRIVWNGQSVILASAQDISQRKQAEAQLQRQSEADQLMAAIAQTINQSVRLNEVLDICLEQIRQFLQCDRVLVCRFNPTYDVVIELEAVSQPEFSFLGRTIHDPCFGQEWAEAYQRGYMTVRPNIYTEDLPACYVEFLAQMQVQACLAVGILQADQIWGLLIVHHCQAPYHWQPLEIDLLKQLGLQIGIAGQKASLYTQLENQLAQKEVLLKEVHHRVKNNLQVISSMLWLQTEATNHPAVSRALKDTRNRLQAMSLIHETLYQHGDLGQIHFHDYIQCLATSILAVYSSHPDQIVLQFDLQPVVFNLETAMPCGLLLNELITNAIKHGFPNHRSGKVCITLEEQLQPEVDPTVPVLTEASHSSLFQNPLSRPSSYYLTVQDNGIGMPENLNLKKLKSLGLKIAYDLALQLDGKLELERMNGTRFCLTFSALEYGKRL